MNLKKITLVLVGACMLLAGQAQIIKRNCGTMEHLQMLKDQDPSVEQNMRDIEQYTAEFIAKGGNSGSRAVVTIPVVVHVLYNTSAQNISDALIQAQIAQLNLDFARLNADASSTPAAFASVAANTNVQFCLAQRDPNGNPTTGIVRKATTVTSFSSNNAVKYSSSGGDNAWAASSYLNLWVCNLGGGLLGYAQFPGGAAATDGVVVLYTSVGSRTVPGSASPYNYGRTATHEVGHWLNLYHIWGDDGTACTGSDNVSDTPNQADENYGCPTFPTISCSNGPNGDMFMNYMDYTNDACMNMFTIGQTARIQSLFGTGGSRVGLLTSLGCQAPSTSSCGTPSGLASSGITTTTATVSWAAVSGAVSYNLQYKTSAATTWTTVTSTTTSKALSGLTAGTAYNYQVQAVCSAASSNYSAASSFTTTSAGGATCSNNYESNNTRTSGTSIAVNTDIVSMLGTSGDNDYFKFTNTTAAKNIYVTLTNLPLDYDLKLYNSSGTTLATSQNGGTTAEGIKYNNAPVGTYYARVYGYNNAYTASACYTLRASTSSTTFRFGDEEQNDSNKPMSDMQYSLYPNPSSGMVNLDMYFDEAMEKVNVRVFDMMGREVRAYEFNEAVGNLKANIDMNDAANGIYHVVISSPAGKEMKKMIINR